MTTPVFYDPRMNVAGLDSFSPSAGKPARFVELLQHHAFHAYGPNMLGKVRPVTPDDLRLAHANSYVADVFAGREMNGFDNFDPRVPESCLWTIGCLLSASRHAMKHPEIPVCAPVSGFHHAGYSFGGGYCTFNGLMVVAAKLVHENRFMKVAILDCDMHYGNGTVDIMDKHPALGMHILPFTAGQHLHGDDPAQESLEFQAWLYEAIKDINAFAPDLVLYQAGADPHVADPLGGYLTTKELQQRDRTVFRGIKAPVAWVLAGGYQKPKDGTIFTDPVLAIHRNTLRESDASVPFRKAALAANAI